MTATISTRPPAPERLGAPVLVDDLRIAYRRGRRDLTEVVHGVSFEIAAGSTVALVGQSGSGKSTIAHALAGLLPDNGVIVGGRALVQGRDIAGLGGRAWRSLHGDVIGFVPQDPLSSLDPLERVGKQIGQTLAIHKTVPRSEVRARVHQLLDQVGIKDPAQRSKAYPHELSGGQLQRVLIAIAIAARPSILVADEPTSALDVTVQKRILDLIGQLGEDLGLATLLITHDLSLAQERSDELVVLNHGEVKDYGPATRVVERPSDPYTSKLLGDAPVNNPDKYARLLAAHDVTAEPAITVRDVTKLFGTRGDAGAVLALDDVSLTVRRGTTHALVGESGSGKTTLARIIAGITPYDAGEIRVGDRVLPHHPAPVNRHADQLQLVYQNPLAAVDPRYPVARIIEEPLLLRGSQGRSSRRAAVRELLDRVALPQDVLTRRARELSGGQRQRVAIARALVLAPDVLVLDEPTSALDVSVQAQIIDLLLELQRDQGLTYLFITHDLSLVRQISDRVSVLRHGRLVEQGRTRELFARPKNPYTRRLLEAVPGIAQTRREAVA